MEVGDNVIGQLHTGSSSSSRPPIPGRAAQYWRSCHGTLVEEKHPTQQHLGSGGLCLRRYMRPWRSSVSKPRGSLSDASSGLNFPPTRRSPIWASAGLVFEDLLDVLPELRDPTWEKKNLASTTPLVQGNWMVWSGLQMSRCQLWRGF